MIRKNEKNDYIGTAGHLAAMAEFAYRGYNVAIPEIDKGDDVFVINDVAGTLWRIQVKTANPKKNNSSLYQFNVRESAITTPQQPELHFIFVMRHQREWRYCIVARNVLQNYTFGASQLGSFSRDQRQRDRRVITVTLQKDGKLTSGKIDLSHHLEDWSTWPNLVSQRPPSS